jgi:hypothetical protein
MRVNYRVESVSENGKTRTVVDKKNVEFMGSDFALVKERFLRDFGRLFPDGSDYQIALFIEPADVQGER